MSCAIISCNASSVPTTNSRHGRRDHSCPCSRVKRARRKPSLLPTARIVRARMLRLHLPRHSPTSHTCAISHFEAPREGVATVPPFDLVYGVCLILGGAADFWVEQRILGGAVLQRCMSCLIDDGL